MAKTTITPEHRAAAEATVASLAECGVEASVSEVLLAGAIANAVASIVVDPEERPDLDSPLARQMFDTRTGGAAGLQVALRTLAVARGLIRARRMTASMDQQARYMAEALVEMFAAMDVAGTQPAAPVVAEQPERATDDPRLRLKLDPDLADGFHWTIHDTPDAVLMESIRTWMDNALVGDDFTIELVEMTDAEVAALPDV